MNSRDGLAARVGEVGLLAAIYFTSAKFSLLAAIPPGYATAVWPPSGIAMAAVLLLGWRAWTGIWLGAMLVNVTVQASLVAAIVMGTGNTLEALAGAFLVRRHLGAATDFKHARDVFMFLAIAISSPAIAASVATLPLAVVDALPPRDLLRNWWTWWQGDAMGIILVTPLILGWSGAARQPWTPRRIAEAAVLCAGTLLTCSLIFGEASPSRVGSTFPPAFLIFPLILWAAVRFGQREVAALSAAVSAFAIAMTVQGRGPFATHELNRSLLFLLAFMSTVAVTGLLLNAVVRERARIVATLGSALHQLREQATTDVLTGLHNRRFLEDHLRRELARARRARAPVAVIMLDIDFFKRVNDRWGHAAGDAVLMTLGALLRRHVRASDVACRYGGEEFTLILPETSLGVARRKAESIRLDARRARAAMAGATLSAGVAVFPHDGKDADTLMRAADEALYKAKQAGRNRVEVSPDRPIQGAPARSGKRAGGAR